MGLIDVLEFQDQTRSVLGRRLPEDLNANIRIGAQLIVRESQVAIFYRGGQALDTFSPGRHTLTTANLPLLSRAINKVFGDKTPFQAEVVFVDVGLVDDDSCKWGTKEPMNFQDSTMGIVQLRSFGTMTYKIVVPQLFIGKRMKSSAIYKTSDFSNWARDTIVQNMIGVLGEVMKSIVDLPALLSKISSACKARVAADFAKNGVELEDLRILGISPPPEVQAKINELSGFGLFKRELPQFQQYQMAYAIRDAAQNEGGPAGAGMGMGMGMGMGFMMPGVMAQGMGHYPPGYPTPGYPGYPLAAPVPPGYPPTPGYPPSAPGYAPAVGASAPVAPSVMSQTVCAKCQTPLVPGMKFCANCGAPVASAKDTGTVPCVQCKAPLPKGSRFCPNCGTDQTVAAPKCVQCQKELAPGTRFCPYCGVAQPA